MKQDFRLDNGTTIYMTEEMYNKHSKEIQEASDYLLKHCRGIHSLDFSDLSTGGIQIGGTHHSNPGYIMMYLTIRYDFSNFKDIIKLFIRRWNSFTEGDVKSFNKFTEDGEKYGWN